MSTQSAIDCDQAVAMYDASFSSGLSRGAQRYLAGWMERHNPVYAARWRRAISSFRKDNAKPPIMDVCDLYEKLTRHAERPTNQQFCPGCHNLGHGVYLRVRLNGRLYPVRRGGTFSQQCEGMWVERQVTKEHEISQGLVPCHCAKGQEAERHAKMSSRVIAWIREHCWLRLEDVHKLEDALYADVRNQMIRTHREADAQEARAAEVQKRFALPGETNAQRLTGITATELTTAARELPCRQPR